MPDRDTSALVERLKRRSDFRAAARGARAATSAFVLQARPRDDQGCARVGFTVSRHVGKAVERNRVRRRLREMVRISAAATGAEDGRLRPGHDYVLIGRRAALAAPFADMIRELSVALGRVHARKRAEGPGRPAGGGTGGRRGDALHEAGSPWRPAKPQRGGRTPPQER